MMRWKFSLKSGLEVVFFCFDPVVITQIRRKINSLGEDPVKNGEDPAWDGSFHSNLVLRWSFLLQSRGCRTDLKKNQQIQRRFGDFRWWFGEDLEVTTSTDPTVVHRSPIRLDPRLPAVGGGSFNVPPDVSGSVPSWAQTQPEPTRGHPYQ